MQLHLTINQRLVDSIKIDPARREDKSYLERMKAILLKRYEELQEVRAWAIGFYLDPLPPF